VSLLPSPPCSAFLLSARYRDGVRNELDRLGAHVLVRAQGLPHDAHIALHGASWPCYLKGRYLDEVRAVPSVATAAPVFMTAVYDADGRQAVYVGAETNILALKLAGASREGFPNTTGIWWPVRKPHGATAGESANASHLPGIGADRTES